MAERRLIRKGGSDASYGEHVRRTLYLEERVEKEVLQLVLEALNIDRHRFERSVNAQDVSFGAQMAISDKTLEPQSSAEQVIYYLEKQKVE